jgi:ATP-dependent Lhr-like helicase
MKEVTSLQASNYNNMDNSFEKLATPIKKWVWKQGWKSLRDIQSKAIPHLLSGGDAIISAATAGGKTEAAFLPLLSRVFNERSSSGFDILYISPLKALINDQYNRLEELCEDLDLPVTKWHGDVSSNIKQKAFKNPQGVLLITPESLEAMLMRKGLQVSHVFSGTQAIIIDELHAFMGTERGVQLRSIMNRLEVLTGHQIDRIGLSATLGNMSMAADYLRNNSSTAIPIIEGGSGGSELKLQLRSYIQENPKKGVELQFPVKQQIAEHIFKATKGTHNLVFAGSKANVESYASILRDLCEDANLPNEFFTHHANISRPDRESLERRLKKGTVPTTAVCTSTLELGIDIGDVESVVQIGCSGSVSALRQRMGRSGRRNNSPAILRAYNVSEELSDKSHMIDFLRLPLIQAIAEIELLLAGIYEPSSSVQLHLSTLVHQILALIVERGGVRAKGLFDILSRATPFNNISSSLFMNILRAMARSGSDLLEQAPDGILLLGKEGEKLTSHYSFYAVFETTEEFRVICGGKNLGTLPVMGPAAKGTIIIFSGRRWQIIDVHQNDKVIEVKPSKGGNPPKFKGNGPSRHRIVDEKMQEIYRTNTELQYLNTTAKELLQEGFSSYNRYGLSKTDILSQGDNIIIFPWAGTSMISGLIMLFQHKGYKVADEAYAISVEGLSVTRTHKIIEEISCGNIPDIEEMAWSIKNKSMRQYDHYLTDELLVQQLASILPTAEEFKAWAQKVYNKL